jgi:hypothetical protein
MKICPLGADLFHPEGRTDMKNLIFTFRSLVNVSKISTHTRTRTHTIIKAGNSKVKSKPTL